MTFLGWDLAAGEDTHMKARFRIISRPRCNGKAIQIKFLSQIINGHLMTEQLTQGWQPTHTTAGQSHFFMAEHVLSACCQVARNVDKPVTPSASGGFVCGKCYSYSLSLQSIGEIS